MGFSFCCRCPIWFDEIYVLNQTFVSDFALCVSMVQRFDRLQELFCCVFSMPKCDHRSFIGSEKGC